MPSLPCTLHVVPGDLMTIAQRNDYFGDDPKALPSGASSLVNDIHPIFNFANLDVFAVETSRTQLQQVMEDLQRVAGGNDSSITAELTTKKQHLEKDIRDTERMQRDELLVLIRPAFQLASAILQDDQ